MLFPWANWGGNNKVEMPSNHKIYEGKIKTSRIV